MAGADARPLASVGETRHKAGRTDAKSCGGIGNCPQALRGYPWLRSTFRLEAISGDNGGCPLSHSRHILDRGHTSVGAGVHSGVVHTACHTGRGCNRANGGSVDSCLGHRVHRAPGRWELRDDVVSVRPGHRWIGARKAGGRPVVDRHCEPVRQRATDGVRHVGREAEGARKGELRSCAHPGTIVRHIGLGARWQACLLSTMRLPGSMWPRRSRMDVQPSEAPCRGLNAAIPAKRGVDISNIGPIMGHMTRQNAFSARRRVSTGRCPSHAKQLVADKHLLSGATDAAHAAFSPGATPISPISTPVTSLIFGHSPRRGRLSPLSQRETVMASTPSRSPRASCVRSMRKRASRIA